MGFDNWNLDQLIQETKVCHHSPAFAGGARGLRPSQFSLSELPLSPSLLHPGLLALHLFANRPSPLLCLVGSGWLPASCSLQPQGSPSLRPGGTLIISMPQRAQIGPAHSCGCTGQGGGKSVIDSLSRSKSGMREDQSPSTKGAEPEKQQMATVVFAAVLC
uniref:Uncharacterized protein n=1 Tax=Pipistrellus kuhlii TaxID=59472 RepID=A0A7J7YWY6_PIPKU|nr:hypothetical protein mPipKuh1_009935 [Pipistrellus kuhlii]